MTYHYKQLFITRLFQLAVVLNFIIVSYQASHLQSVKTRIKESVSNDPDVTSLYKSSDEYNSIKRDVRDVQNLETQIVGGSRQISHRRRSGIKFSPWSTWSLCDFDCKQTRERFCITKRKCGDVKHIEEKLCPRNLCSPILSTSHQQNVHNININNNNNNNNNNQNNNNQNNQNKQQPSQYHDNINPYDGDIDDHDYILNKKRTKIKKKRRKTVLIDVDDDDDYRYINNIEDHPIDERVNDDLILKDSYNKNNNSNYNNINNNNRNNNNRNKIIKKRQKIYDVIKLQQSESKELLSDEDEEFHESSDEYNNSHLKSIDILRPQINFYGVPVETTKQPSLTKHITNFSMLVPHDDKYQTHTQEWDGIEWMPIPVHNSGKNFEIIDTISDTNDDLLSSEMFDDYSSNDSDEIISDEKSDNFVKTKIIPKKTKKLMEKAVFDAPQKYKRVYSKWTKWSNCSPKCTTRRFKRCRLKEVCGNEVLRDIAYCYVEGTFCQEWIKSQMHNINKGKKPVPRPSEISAMPYYSNRRQQQPALSSPYMGNNNNNNNNNNAVQSNSVTQFPQKSNPYKYSTPQNFQCGVPAVRRRAKYNTYNMLKIIGGKVSRRGMWPWQVVVLNGHKEPFCGGTLVSPQWILTAAHCYKRKLYVILGEHNLAKRDGTEIEYQIKKFIKHPKYNKSTVDNDVAMIKLPASALLNNYIGLACLPHRFQNLPIGTQCKIIGWGKRYNTAEAGTNVLHEAEVPIISTSECETVYNDYTITNNMFCAGHKKGRIDTCAGDSGGPLLCRDGKKSNHPWTIFGITSFGDGCGKINKFGIYTKLPNYVDWIWEIINCNGECKY